jgi:hypothetical protein
LWDRDRPTYMALARAAIEACADELDELVERRKAEKRPKGASANIASCAGYLRHKAKDAA